MAGGKRSAAGRGGRTVRVHVNGKEHAFAVGTREGQLTPAETLATTLRDRLGLTGTKVACDDGACGCCTVHVDGEAILSCMTLTVECDGRHVRTVEGLSDPATGALDPLQQAFIDETGFQCGYCTPGILMSAKAFLAENPRPTEEEVKEGLSGNFCRCISHYHVVRAVLAAAYGREDR